MVKYYLISRRSKYRSGSRFYNRGIDENAKCANFIETEQILVIGNEIVSLLSLSGSHPIFWEQKSATDRIRLTRNKELTALPFLEHLNQIKADYGRVLMVNILERANPGEKLLTTALEQLI
jgi:DNA mismatch repair protein MutH